PPPTHLMSKLKIKMNLEIYKTNEYESLVEDCKSIIVEGIFRSRQELIEAYQQLGERIVNDSLYKKHEKLSQGKFIKQLVEDIGKGPRTIYYAIQYVEKREDKALCMAVQSMGKNASWNKIKQLLPRPKENKINIPIPKNKYGLIVIDPPWKYGTEFNDETRRVASPYGELSQEELKKIEIPSSDNSVLWLWTTHKFLWDAKELLEHWGFEYKLTLVWNKEKLGMGVWLRCQAEFCLLGIKGKPEWKMTNERDILSEARREHSRKPSSFYEMAKKLTLTQGLDIFGREPREGWDIWGNESTKF
ncbi:MAG: MT-A70 family methyltransferase, partial [Nanoarchaeota archaeon]